MAAVLLSLGIGVAMLSAGVSAGVGPSGIALTSGGVVSLAIAVKLVEG